MVVGFCVDVDVGVWVWGDVVGDYSIVCVVVYGEGRGVIVCGLFGGCDCGVVVCGYVGF